jgi:hypothetical protein
MRATLRHAAHVDDGANAGAANHCGELDLAGGAVAEGEELRGYVRPDFLL